MTDERLLLNHCNDYREFQSPRRAPVAGLAVELDEKYSNSSSVGKASAALVDAYEELIKLIQAGRVDADNSDWARYGTPSKQVDYIPEDTYTKKARESKQHPTS